MDVQQIRHETVEFINPLTGAQDCDDRLYVGDDSLHCGDCLEVLMPDGWKNTRVEKSEEKGWYLVGVNATPAGLWARVEE